MDKQEIKSLTKKIEKLNEHLESQSINKYMSLIECKRRLFMINFISGIGKGLGYAVGFSFLSGLLIYLLSSTIDIPVIGKYIAEFMDLIEIYRIK